MLNVFKMKIESIGNISRLSAVQRIPIGIEEAWDFFSNPKNLATITPDKLNFRILSDVGSKIFAGQLIHYAVNPLPLYSTNWLTEITYVEEQRYFVDEQRFGPYELWHHKHFFKSIPGGVEVTDIVDFKIPFKLIGRTIFGRLIKK